MKRRPGPALFLIVILAVGMGSLIVGEGVSHAPLGSKIAVDGLLFAAWACLAWLIWVE